jgi:RNA polymerase sigma-70 factor (ECF subfamily)
VHSEDHVREVYDVSYGRLVAQIFAICGDQHEAEDVVQDAFAKALIHSARFRSVDNPEAWLRTVALNLLRSRWRRVIRWRRLMPSLPGLAAEVELSADHMALVEALKKLAPSLREVVVLHHLADLSTREIAETTGIAEGTVKSRLVKGRDLLASLLAEDEETHHA